MGERQQQFISWMSRQPEASLLYAYDQGDDLRIKQLDITANGWCLGICLEWLISKYLRYHELGFWQWLETDKAAAKVRFIMLGQMFKINLIDTISRGYYTRRLGSYINDPSDKRLGFDWDVASSNMISDLGNMVAEHLKKKGLNKKQHYEKLNQFVDYSEIPQFITSSIGRFSYIKIVQNFTRVAHAQGVYFDGGNWYFLDPTYGEVKCSSKENLFIWYPRFMRYLYPWPITTLVIEKFEA